MDKTNAVADKGTLVKEYAIITAGIFLTAAAVYFFMMPANIVLGSITGLAIVLVNFIPVQVSVMTFILNVFCLVIGFLLVGKEFGAKTVYTSILLPAFLYVLELLFPNNSSLTNDLLLDTLCCIILISIGQTLMFNANASSGGLDIVAKILNKYFHLELGKGIALAGILTVATTILVYDAKTLIVGILGTYFNGLVLDEYISGFASRKRVCFLSEKYQEIAEYIMHDIKRGVTLYEAKGGYDQSKKVEVQTILTQNEYGQLIDYIHKTDPKAFVTVSTVSEVVGYWNKAR